MKARVDTPQSPIMIKMVSPRAHLAFSALECLQSAAAGLKQLGLKLTWSVEPGATPEKPAIRRSCRLAHSAESGAGTR